MTDLVMLTVFLLMLSQVHCRAVTTQDNSHPPKADDLSSPQYLYMEHLRLTKQDASAKDGVLIATSFKDTFEVGRQMGAGVVELNFTIPRQSVAGERESGTQSPTTTEDINDELRPITSSELWLFPNFTSDIIPEKIGQWYVLDLGFVFTLENFKREVEDEIFALWRDTDDCIMVDITKKTKVIHRKLQNNDLNETNVNVKITLHHIERYRGNPAIKHWQTICPRLSNRSSNTSFLVVKYVPDESESPTVERKRRETSNSSSHSCSVREFKVRLQDALGDWVASPKEAIDVGMCSGECDIERNQDLFSKRAILKDRLKNLGLSPIPHSFEVSCVPASLTSTPVLIQEKNLNSSYYLVNWPIKVNSCGCR